MESDLNYSLYHFNAKHSFVESVMDEFGPKMVLDVGCNNGHFSAVAAKSGARVISIDSDPVVVGEVWRRARSEGLDILPLVVNLTRPSPSIGWRNQECSAFIERVRGAFDAVLMLAVIHHFLVSERIPLTDILSFAAELTTDVLLIEYVDPNDTMFRRIARGRDDLFNELTPELFEITCQRHFEIIRSEDMGHPSRKLYLLRKKTNAGNV